MKRDYEKNENNEINERINLFVYFVIFVFFVIPLHFASTTQQKLRLLTIQPAAESSGGRIDTRIRP